MKKIVLASTSPRRKALLEQIGLRFTVDAGVREDAAAQEGEARRLAVEISSRKAHSVAHAYPDAIVIAADTMVVIDGRAIGKPRSQTEASAILGSLSGRAHIVITGFTVLDTLTGKAVSQSVQTVVHMKRLTKAEIETYVKTGEPLDAAGAYAIQGLGSVLVEGIEGDYFNVVGLPLCALVEVLKQFGVAVL